VNLFYSTPSIYTASKLAQEGVAFSTTTTDFFPYGSQPHSFWTGYFTSRPALKGYVRDLSSFFTAARQLQALVGGVADLGPANPLYALERAMGVVQHHDAVAGTERQHVAFDYARQMAAGKLRADASVSASLAALTGYADSPFVQCDLANATVCPFLEAGKAAVVLLYNTQGQGKGGAQQQQQQLDMEHVRLPVGLPPGVTSYAVTGPTGDAVQAQLLPLSPSDLALRAYYGASNVTVAWLAFLAAVPALGHAAYFIEPVGPTGPAGPAAVASDVVVVQQQPPSTSSSSSSQTDQTLTNGILTLTISAATGMLSSYANAETGLSVPLVQEWFFYNASVGNDVDPQASGAYVFRPNSSTPFPISSSSSPAAVTLVTGPLVSEARITVSPWVVQTVRLWANASYAEVEWTVGPIPMADGLGKEVVTRFSTPLATDRTWVTDSNGREGQVRVRDYRPTWTYQVNEPVAGNFYPVNTWISTSDVTTGERLSVATDRTQAGSSMVDGSLELLVHRRLTADDKKGVAEPLDEPGLDWSGSGLVVRGTHRLALDPARDAPGQLKRSTQDLLFRPLVAYASLGAQTPAQWVAAHTATRTGLTGPLPPNVALVTLHAQGGDNGTVLLRLAHLFEEGEDPVLSQNATVALATLFSAFTITSAVETTLTANQGLGAVKRHVVVALGGGEGPGGKVGNLTLPVPLYDAMEDGPKGAGLEVTLTPMQIRTFLCATAAAAGTAAGMGTAGRI
jgi:alpha-mannosidase